jgi:aspartyl aminopeptidase
MLKNVKSEIKKVAKEFASEIIDGLNQSVTPYHAVSYIKSKLLSDGFNEINEK